MAVFAASKTVLAYAGDFTAAATFPTNGEWGEKCVLDGNATDYYKFTITTAGEMDVKLMAYAPYLTYTIYNSNFVKISEQGLLTGGETETSPCTELIRLQLSQGIYYVPVTGRAGIR
ncbi:MAG: hypothetical protein HFH42_12830 [Lachnospiraceae bacterium]|jgi:hypothetical protein|nr:hypothetical protein [Lachnospiraceae bacterium]